MNLGQKWGSGQNLKKQQEVDGGLKVHHMNPLAVNYVDHWMSHWVNYAAETVFDVNLLMIDKK